MQAAQQPSAFPAVLNKRPHAVAEILGSGEYPSIRGSARFYQTTLGVLTVLDVTGLPAPKEPCKSPVFALHIHNGASCTGNMEDPFADTMAHYNPEDCLHPYHAGDLPPLFGCDGRAFQASLSDRFTVPEVLGRTIIIHANPDDFTTQPSGASGKKIACGEIRAAL